MRIPQGRFNFDIERTKRPAGLTSYAGLPLLTETAVALGMDMMCRLGQAFRSGLKTAPVGGHPGAGQGRFKLPEHAASTSR